VKIAALHVWQTARPRTVAVWGAESEAVQAIVNDARQGHWDESNRKMSWLIRAQQ
jgi:hypothetical protein